MNEKTDSRRIAFWIVMLAVWLVSGCQSQPNAAGSIIVQSAEDAGRLKEQNRQLTAIADSLVSGIDSIENRINSVQNGIESAQADARGAEQDIDRAIRLFIEYKSRVDQFLDEYRKLQEQIKNGH